MSHPSQDADRVSPWRAELVPLGLIVWLAVSAACWFTSMRLFSSYDHHITVAQGRAVSLLALAGVAAFMAGPVVIAWLAWRFGRKATAACFAAVAIAVGALVLSSDTAVLFLSFRWV
ncbi:hypothetical protein LO763_07865 [Glycomyces sp. A-F 0318]|uniref:hypothetical protein n=1 Tax=Glycomyces amatae TaxID=2881355 RepID=UPI001E4B7073|nr:hypothetical protein [Glycomyces amatae]MCD0443543.1 hypothetical protein [Glycomyces amatae]